MENALNRIFNSIPATLSSSTLLLSLSLSLSLFHSPYMPRPLSTLSPLSHSQLYASGFSYVFQLKYDLHLDEK